MIESMSRKELFAQGVLFAEKIDEAFRKYHHRIIAGTKLQMQEFLCLCLELNKEQAYADFYYARLKPEEQARFSVGLSETLRKTLHCFEREKGQVYYPLTEENIDFLAEITAENWLFSTFFFAGEKAILWGNYDLEYPLFCETDQTMTKYLAIANRCGLEIRT